MQPDSIEFSHAFLISDDENENLLPEFNPLRPNSTENSIMKMPLRGRNSTPQRTEFQPATINFSSLPPGRAQEQKYTKVPQNSSARTQFRMDFRH